MYWMFVVLYIVLFIIQLVNLFKAVKNKDNKNWITLLSSMVGSILSCILIIAYELINSYNTYLDGVFVLFVSVIAMLVYACVSALSVILKLLQMRNLKNKDIEKEKIDKNKKKRRLSIPIICILFITLCICFGDFLVYEHNKIVENNRYNTVKKAKLVDMVEYINNKYDLEYTVKDNIFYREYNYDDVEKAPKKYNDFYIGIFDDGKKKITVSVNKDFLSDNAQLKDISYLIRDYYSNITGIDIDYVMIKNKDDNYQDDLINHTLQFKFNDVITQDNIEEFIDEILSNNNIEMIFYVKDCKNRNDMLERMIDKLSFLENRSNIEGLVIYLYDSKEKLIVKENNILLYGDYKYDKVHYNYYSSRMFGIIYVPNSIEFDDYFDKENTFVTIAFSNKKYPHAEKYKDKDIKTIKDWTIHDFK